MCISLQQTNSVTHHRYSNTYNKSCLKQSKLFYKKNICVPFLLSRIFPRLRFYFTMLSKVFIFWFLLNVFNIQYALNIVSLTSVILLIFWHTSYYVYLQDVPTFQVIIIFHFCHPLPSFTFYSSYIYPFNLLEITLQWYVYIITIPM